MQLFIHRAYSFSLSICTFRGAFIKFIECKILADTTLASASVCVLCTRRGHFMTGDSVKKVISIQHSATIFSTLVDGTLIAIRQRQRLAIRLNIITNAYYKI